MRWIIKDMTSAKYISWTSLKVLAIIQNQIKKRLINPLNKVIIGLALW